MVKICSVSKYPIENENKYIEYFEKFTHPLHIFQKWAIEGIVEGHHVLVTAPTGSGKSLPAEFALDFFYSKGKKTIYCSPIKSLSNQKFYDFKNKYPHITIGLITGDIRCNPDADVLIMTTEILLNKLYNLSTDSLQNSTTSFDMNIETELGCVVFDEIHMISNDSRGFVWENSIMLLPKHIQMIGLSATLDDPEKFAKWLEERDNMENNKVVYLTSKKIRTVPLIHYSFITAPQGIFKAIKDKTVHEEIKSIINRPFVIQNATGKYNEEHYFKMNKMLKLFDSAKIWVKRAHVLNQVTKYLTEQQMTPCICYIFSIKNLEIAAREVGTDLLEFDSKVPYIVEKECEQILRNKLSNYEEYLHLPEYVNLISLLQKGIATHHSKMLPILREIVEILFAKGYIKLLFATESVAIGLNLPVKTCIFTDVYKHDDQCLRILQAHEYTQAAGRAGRLGIDTVGNVIHLNNLFRETTLLAYKGMMNGTPQTLTSKFKISYNLVLNMMNKETNVLDFVKKSMISKDLNKQKDEIEKRISVCKEELDKIKDLCSHLKTPSTIVENFITYKKDFLIVVNKKHKEIERKIKSVIELYPFVEEEVKLYEKMYAKEKDLLLVEDDLNQMNSYIQDNINKVYSLLQKEEFIMGDGKVSLKGKIASNLKEIPCLIFANLIMDKSLDELSPVQLVGLFSCFTNITVHSDFKEINPNSNDKKLQSYITKIAERMEVYENIENDLNIHSCIENPIHYDLLNYIEEWCSSNDTNSCKLVLQKIMEEKQIFLGDFVKALLKIHNICLEMETIAGITQNVSFLNKLQQIPSLILKFVVTNQSLYV
jgi:superfamily II RNA helicase